MYHNQELICSFPWQEVIKEQENYELKLQEEKLADKKEKIENLILSDYIPLVKYKGWEEIKTNNNTITPPKSQETLKQRIRMKFKVNEFCIIEPSFSSFDIENIKNEFAIICSHFHVSKCPLGLMQGQIILVGTGITKKEAIFIIGNTPIGLSFTGTNIYDIDANNRLKWVHENELEDFINTLKNNKITNPTKITIDSTSNVGNEDVTIDDYKMKVHTAKEPRRLTPTELSEIQRVAEENRGRSSYYTGISRREPFEATIDSKGTKVRL